MVKGGKPHSFSKVGNQQSGRFNRLGSEDRDRNRTGPAQEQDPDAHTGQRGFWEPACVGTTRGSLLG